MFVTHFGTRFSDLLAGPVYFLKRISKKLTEAIYISRQVPHLNNLRGILNMKLRGGMWIN